MCADCREDVFEVPVSAPAGGGDEGEEDSPEPQNGHGVDGSARGGDSVFMESIFAVSGNGKGRDAPVVKDMKRSALV